jgi:hypothetical protein
MVCPWPLVFEGVLRSLGYSTHGGRINGQVHGNGKEDGADVAGREETGDDGEPVDLRLCRVSNLYPVHEREERTALLCFREKRVQRGDEGMHLPDMSGHEHDGAFACLLLHERF